MSDTMASIDLVALLNQLREEETEYNRQLVRLQEEIGTLERAFAIAERRKMGVKGSLAPAESVVSSPLDVANERPAYIGGHVSPVIAERPSPVRVAELARKVRGLTQIEALKRIAQANEGIVRTIEAKPVFIKAGLSKGSPRNIGSHLYHLLDASPEFEKVGTGVFRWLPYCARMEARQDVGPSRRVQEAQLKFGQDETGVLAAGNPEGDATEQTQEPPPERNGYGRVGTMPPD